MTTDTDATTRIHISRDMVGQHTVGDVGLLASTVGYWTGMAGAALLGALTVVAVVMVTPMRPTEVVFDLLRAATLGGLVVASFCWFIHYEANHVVQRLDQSLTRNRDATLSIRQQLDDMQRRIAVDQAQVMAVVQGGARAAQDHRHAIHDAADRLGGEWDQFHREFARLSGMVEVALAERIELLRILAKQVTAAAVKGQAAGMDPEALDAFRRLHDRLSGDGG